MYKVEITQDSLQEAAINRRRKLDEERKKRIFDPKKRVLGIDVQALEEQIKIKNEIKAVQKEREMAFDEYSKYTNDILTMMDNKVEQTRRDHIKSVNEFRAQQQQPHQRREFDLNDPKALLKEKPARVGDEDERCGVSSLQRFDGEDLSAGERLRMQKEQRRVWAEQQMWEKNRKMQKEHEEHMRFVEYERKVSAKAQFVQNVLEETRTEQAKTDTALNLQLAAQKRMKEAEARARELEQNAREIHNNLTNVNSDYFHQALTPEQREEILLTQARQREEAERNRERQRMEEQRWAQQEFNQTRAALLLERQKARAAREMASQIMEENKRKAAEDQQKWQYINKVVYSNQPNDEYFAQFNTTSR